MKNIDEFNRYVALIMGDLYESFPVKKDIALSSYPNAENNFYDAFDSMIIATSTAQFLCEEGFIKCESIDDQSLKSTILTTKGLAALSKTPESVKSKQTIGEKLSSLSKISASALSSASSITNIIRQVLS